MAENPAVRVLTPLERLIQERKRDKVLVHRLQRTMDIEKIRSRVVPGFSFEPFPEGSFDRFKSNGIWEDVLCHLTTPADLTSAYMCQTFAGILDQRRMAMALPGALASFQKNVRDASSRGCETGMKYWKRWKNVCLHARLASKEWKESFDFEMYDSFFKKEDWYVGAGVLAITDDPKSNACVLKDEESVKKAIEAFNLSTVPSSPMLRNIHAIMVSTSITEEFRQKIIEFLKVHGKSAWSLYFEWNSAGNVDLGYRQLCEMLECMPNLKGLQVCMDFDQYYESAEGRQDFENMLALHAFPVLESLEHLHCPFKLEETFLSRILSGCRSLKSVVISEYQTITDEMLQHALVQLHIQRFSGNAATFLACSQPNWRLQHLAVDFKNKIPASIIFPAINRFRETLQQLLFWGPGIAMDNTNFRLELQQLKVLRMPDICNDTMGFDDILHLVSLEKILVWTVNFEKLYAKVKVKRFLERNELQRSNIWECFPYLKTLDIRTTT